MVTTQSNIAFDLIGLTGLRNDPRYNGILDTDTIIDGQVEDGPQLTVAVIDSGIFAAHPELDDNFLAYIDLVDNQSLETIPLDQLTQITAPEATEDRNGHGTHVAGTIGAEDASIGVAPAVSLISLDVLTTGNSVSPDAVVNGFQWILDNRQGAIDGQNYRIIASNTSLGIGGPFTSPDQVLDTAPNAAARRASELVQELEETAGVTVVSANGNNYDNQAINRAQGGTLPNGQPIPLKNINAPAIFSTLGVGALDPETADITIFSQRLDADNVIFAPGNNIVSTAPIGSDLDLRDGIQDGRGPLSGTSMASPHVAGAVALLQDAALTFGDRLLTTAEVQEILLQTADSFTDDVEYPPLLFDTNGDGIVDVSIPVESTGDDFLRINVYEAIQEVERRVSDVDVPIPDDIDPNGTLAGAVSLETDLGFNLADLSSFTVVANAAIGDAEVGPTDVDLLSFLVPDSGGTVTIQTDVDDPGDPVDTILRLFDASGNELALDNNGGDGLFSRVEAILPAGQYFVGVSGFDNFNYNPEVPDSGVPGGTGTYSIGFQFAPGFIPSGDQNGTIATAFSLDTLVFDEAETQVAGVIIGSDPLPGFSDRAAVGRTDVDMIRFDVIVPGLFVIETGPGFDDDDPVDSLLRLFDSNGTQLEFDDDGGAGLFSQIETFLNPGTYYVGVSGYDNSLYDPNTLAGVIEGSTGTASLEFQFQPQGNVDPDGIRGGALELDLIAGETSSFLGLIGSDFGIQVNDTDVDLFEFVAPQDGTLLLDTDTPFGPEFNNGTDAIEFSDTILRLFDASGSEIAFSDDDFALDAAGNPSEFAGSLPGIFAPTVDAFGNLVGHGVDSFLSAEVVAGETYYIGVSGFGNDTYSIDSLEGRSAIDTGGFYNFIATYVTSTDLNGTISQAALGPLTGSITGNVAFDGAIEVGSNDVDFYRIESPQGGLLSLDIDSFDNASFIDPVDSIIFLFDAEGTLLAFNDDANAPFSLDSELQYLIDANQPYFIAVSGFGNSNLDPNVAGSGSGGSTGDYVLNTQLLLPDVNAPNNIYVQAFNQALNEANNSFEALTLDVDRDIFGPNFGQLNPNSLDVLPIGSVINGVLGEDPQGSDQFFSAFSTLYLTEASPAIYGSSLDNNAPTGADDVDYFRISFAEPGRYDLRTLVNSKDLGGTEADTLLRLFDNGLNPIAATTSTVGLQGVDSRVLVNIETPGDYWLVVLPEGSAAARFEFPTHGFSGGLSSQELAEFASSQGNYGLSTEEFVFQPVGPLVEQDGAFEVQFNDALSLETLALYDGPDADAFAGASLTVLDGSGTAIRGSFVSEADTNSLVFVPTTPLPAGNYFLTYQGADFVTQFGSENPGAQSQETLDGDGNGTPGGNLTRAISRSNSAVILSIPSFARGPGQSVDIGAPGSGLPIQVSNAAGITDIRLRLSYDDDLLTVSGASLAAGLPADWQILAVDITDDEVIVDLSGNTPLPAGEAQLVTLAATVPDAALFNSSQVLRLSGGAVDGNADPIALTSSSAVHKVAFVGDANASHSIDFTDIRALATVAAASLDTPTTGLDAFDLTDPMLLGDVVTNGSVDFTDLQSLAREALLPGGSDLVPDINGVIEPVPLGPDPVFALSDITDAQVGQTVSTTLSVVGDPENLASFTLTVNYPTALLDITPEAVQLSQALVDAGFQPLDVLQAPVVNEAAGTISFGTFTSGSGVTTPNVPLVTLDFQVIQASLPGIVNTLTIDLTSTAGDEQDQQFLATGSSPNLFFEAGLLTFDPTSSVPVSQVAIFDYEQALQYANPAAIAPTDELGGLPLAQLFDEAFYLNQNPDVAQAIGGGIILSAYDHFVQFGVAEGRDPSTLYSEVFYRGQNPDVDQAISGGAFNSGLEHFLAFGSQEGRDPSSLFSQNTYLANHPDVAAAVGSGVFSSAFEHYVEFGIDEQRLPILSLYNEVHYLSDNPDIAAAVASGIFADGFEHFVQFGQLEGRSPSALYDEASYLTLNPDVNTAVQGGFFRSGFEHYQAFGRFENRAVV